MRRLFLAAGVSTVAAFAVLGVALAQTAPPQENRAGSQMMMGPMAGCPMGPGMMGQQGMAGPGMMGQQGMPGPGMMGRQGMMMDRQGMPSHGMGPGSPNIDATLDALRSALSIRSNQQSAWNAYTAAARADAQVRLDMHGRMLTFMQGPTNSAPDWLAAHRDMMRARVNSLGNLSRAVQRLYGRLDASQRATFDSHGGGMCGAAPSAQDSEHHPDEAAAPETTPAPH